MRTTNFPLVAAVYLVAVIELSQLWFAKIALKDKALEIHQSSSLNVDDYNFPSITDTNQYNETVKGKIYACGIVGNGMEELLSILTTIYPNHTINDLSYLDTLRMPVIKKKLFTNETTTYDLFITPKHIRCNSAIQHWLWLWFKGHIIAYDAESDFEHINQNQYHKNFHYFGHVLNARSTDVVVTYLQATWWAFFKEYLPTKALVDPLYRPVNDRQNFLIYAQSNCVPFREKAAGFFSEIGVVHLAGSCQGIAKNRTNLVLARQGSGLGSWHMNIQWYAHYRFCLVMEHIISHETYITEKVLMALGAGCIPIYSGPLMIFDILNKNAFVFYNASDPTTAIEKVRDLEQNLDLYEQMLAEPILANGNLTLDKYFSFSPHIGNGSLSKRIRATLGV